MVSHCKLDFGIIAPSPVGSARSVQVWSGAVFPSPRWNYNLRYDAKKQHTILMTTKSEEEERHVHCDIEALSWRERRIKADTLVHADVDSVWTALTDYERLADFVPNLVSSRRIASPHPGRIWLEQTGFQRALYWHIEARVVLDLHQFINSDFDRELHFSMVDGDFKKFEGKWFVKCGTRSSTTILSYEVCVIPRCTFPAIFLERIIKSDLPVNLRAVACRAEKLLEGNQNTIAPPDNGSFLTDKEKGYLSPSEFNFGRFSPSSTKTKTKLGLLCKSYSLDRQCMVDEVHLRRFDGLLENGGVHRFVVASITVKAPVRELWNVLTAYERLPEIVPHLAISKILSRENNKVRILQEGCKGLLYMVLHARVVLDLCEIHEQEISFEQVEGDFDSLQGKWVLEQLGNHHTLLKYIVESKMHKDTFLSEAIMEEVIYEDLPSNLCAIRDYVEKGEAEYSSRDDNQSQRICMEDQLSSSDIEFVDDDMDLMDDQVVREFNSNESTSTRQRLRVPGLQRDVEILKAELLKFISEHGQEGFMPMRKQLRLHARVDIEKAITRMGGFRRIASLMNLSLAYKNRKPKGYWDNFENLQEEITRFQRNWGTDPTFMPSRKTFERAGRYDIARALEKWGGLHEVSRLLSLKARHPTKQGNVAIAREKKSGTSSCSEDKNSNTKLNCSYVSQQHSQNWMSELKHLDINL